MSQARTRPGPGTRAVVAAAAVAGLLLLVAVVGCSRGEGGSALPAARAAEAGPPRIVVDRPVFDFGTVPEGGAVRHPFQVRNAGGAPLEIKSVAASCGCTAAAPKERQIPPGGSGQIEVSYDTRGRPGRAEKTVTVVSNDPKTPTTTLTIKVVVDQLLGFEPAFTFLSGFAGDEIKAESWLTGKLSGRARPRVSRVEPPGALAVQPIEADRGGGAQRGLRFRLASKAVGQGTAKVVLATGIAERPELEHLVSWSVRGNVDAPAMVYLDLAQPDLKERVFRVSSRRPDFRLEAARVLEGPFRAELVTGRGAPPEVKLTTTLAEAPAAPVTGKLLIESNDPLEPRKQVALTVAASRPR